MVTIQKIAVTLAIVAMWCCFFSLAMATESQVKLQHRLNKVHSFSAQFSQVVTSADGHVVQQSAGKLWMQRPGLFRWETTSPEENVLISDGKTLWLYAPCIEQVTAIWLSSVTHNTPFLLISSNQAADWRRYQVRQQGDCFELTPCRPDDNLQRLNITVNHRGVITQFTLFEQDGQYSRFDLQKFRRGPVDERLFSFTLPPEVTLDDQRQSRH